MPELQSEYEEKFNILKNNYLKSLKEKHDSLVILKNSIFNTEIQIDKNRTDEIQEAYRHIHKLSGSSAMYGFREISLISNKLELLIKHFIQDNYSSDEKIICENLEALLNEIEKAIIYNKITI